MRSGCSICQDRHRLGEPRHNPGRCPSGQVICGDKASRSKLPAASVIWNTGGDVQSRSETIWRKPEKRDQDRAKSASRWKQALKLANLTRHDAETGEPWIKKSFPLIWEPAEIKHRSMMRMATAWQQHLSHMTRNIPRWAGTSSARGLVECGCRKHPQTAPDQRGR